jgi:hypothetical protein
MDAVSVAIGSLLVLAGIAMIAGRRRLAARAVRRARERRTRPNYTDKPGLWVFLGVLGIVNGILQLLGL